MAGTGIARGSETVDRSQLCGVLRGRLIGPAGGFISVCIGALRALITA